MSRLNKSRMDVPFTMIPNDLLRDPDLSWKAKGVYSYLASMPDGWVFQKKDILKHCKEGRTAWQHACRELVEHGWIERENTYKDGKVCGSEYYLHTKPKPPRPTSRKPARSNTERISNNNNEVNKEHLVSDAKSDDDAHAKTTKRKRNLAINIPDEWSKLSRRLAQSVSKVKKVNCNSNLARWAKAFRLLHEREEIPISRIDSVLTWYCAALEEGLPLYTPEAYCGKSFREKFIRIENAMTRNQKKSLPPSCDEALLEKFAKFFSNLEFDQDSLKELVGGLESWEKRLRNKLKRLQEKETRRAYRELFLTDTFHETFAMFVEDDVRNWREWGGSLRHYAPGNKGWGKFVNMRLRDANRSPKPDLKECLIGVRS